MKPTGIPMRAIQRVTKKHGLHAYFDTLGDYIVLPRIPNHMPLRAERLKLRAILEELRKLSGQFLIPTGTAFMSAYSYAYRLEPLTSR